ncbi:serine/threonine-protein kinase [Planotetraspora kaengkrachanensis]|uniref:non-specific serine/threonine protein kinase n=1 Tax=Planotetraspora kaengkrachanensis TaxID=575193 RepID=A0A8J3LW86_9ACTN|nr:serine/threonine-protein kinase [Planotetraspora kaengkrachanensis]GIG80258.1 hypothetical protein Pka01_33850 [Planotetraspora kaengkrachanensis]
MPEQQQRLIAGRYELITPIGRGTMGTVWRAYDHSLARIVAVKQIRQDSTLNRTQREELRERMIREGRIAARVRHPSVATIHDAIEVDGSPWIVMELIEGRSLEQVIDEEGPLPPRLVAQIGYDLLGALRAAHAQNILHRDVKPGNVLLTDAGRVVLTDFGIAKAPGDSPLTRTGMVIGSPGYTAPERARGDYTGPESDMWSLGATLYFAVEGRPAYERGTVQETLAALMTETADPPTQAGPLRSVLDGLLDKDHTTRLTPDRAASMLRAVAETPSGRAQPSAAPSGAPRTAPPSPSPSAQRPAPRRADDEGTMVIKRPPIGAPGSRPASPPPAAPSAPSSASPASPPPAPPASSPPPGPAPARGGSAGPPEHETTVPGRVPGRPLPREDSGLPQGRPAARPPEPRHAPPPAARRPPVPGPAAGPMPGAGAPGSAVPGPVRSGPAVPGPGGGPVAPRPPQVPGPPPVPVPPASPDDRGLGTDLFAMRGEPTEPRTDGRTRVLTVLAIALVAFIVLAAVAVAAFAAGPGGT